jgi:hypothetical protein
MFFYLLIGYEKIEIGGNHELNCLIKVSRLAPLYHVMEQFKKDMLNLHIRHLESVLHNGSHLIRFE